MFHTLGGIFFFVFAIDIVLLLSLHLPSTFFPDKRREEGHGKEKKKDGNSRFCVQNVRRISDGSANFPGDPVA